MEVLPQVLEIIFEVQRKRINEKKKKLSKLQNAFKIFFSSLWTLLTFKPCNFLISYHFKQFKML